MARLVIPPAVAETIRHLHPGVKRGVKEALRAIAENPAAGEPLQRELADYLKYKVRRFRIVYAVDNRKEVVSIMAVGARTTIYEEFAEQLRKPPADREHAGVGPRAAVKARKRRRG